MRPVPGLPIVNHSIQLIQCASVATIWREKLYQFLYVFEHIKLGGHRSASRLSGAPYPADSNNSIISWLRPGINAHSYHSQFPRRAPASNPKVGTPAPNFITVVLTQPAIASDDAGLPLVEAQQAALGLEKPGELYVDGAYVSAERLAQAQAEGREIIGPAQAAPKKEGRFSVEDFVVLVEQRQATCPAGKTNTQGSRLEEERTGKVSYRFEFGAHGHACPLRSQCLGKDQRHRTLLVGQHHTLLQARRQEQQTAAFKLKTRRRNAIEGTQSELVRAHGLRRARYRGLAKASWQSWMAATACNVKRWLRRTAWQFQQAAAEASTQPAAAVTS